MDGFEINGWGIKFIGLWKRGFHDEFYSQTAWSGER